MPRGTRLHRGPAVHVLFDGGSQGGRGTAGYVIINNQGEEVIRTGLMLGEGLTNNEAESSALNYALHHLATL